MATPSVLSKNYLEKLGWRSGKVERYVSQVQRFFDLFGFIDMVAIHKEGGFLAVQTTGGGNGSARVKKILSNASAFAWIEAGGKIQVHDWKKKKTTGKVEPKIYNITKLDFPEETKKESEKFGCKV